MPRAVKIARATRDAVRALIAKGLLQRSSIASRRREKFLLHAGRVNRLMLPVELSNGGVLSGLWKAATGGRVEGVLTGIAKLRVPAGELEFPFEFPVKLSRKRR
jgi:hypothetical protein